MRSLALSERDECRKATVDSTQIVIHDVDARWPPVLDSHVVSLCSQ